MVAFGVPWLLSVTYRRNSRRTDNYGSDRRNPTYISLSAKTNCNGWIVVYTRELEQPEYHESPRRPSKSDLHAYIHLHIYNVHMVSNDKSIAESC